LSVSTKNWRIAINRAKANTTGINTTATSSQIWQCSQVGWVERLHKKLAHCDKPSETQHNRDKHNRNIFTNLEPFQED
jgi:hypothetical protein